jgi:precorrin-2 dehydrogenase/sirohydrochlorin ferrochelatase
MGYLPLFIELAGRLCIVIGGSEAAERRARALLDAGAVVTVVSPALSPALVALSERGEIRCIRRSYIHGDLSGAVLAYIAIKDAAMAQAAAEEAREAGIPVNVADRPKLCSFITPSVVKRGDLQIAISTGGASPALSRLLREELEARFGPEYAALVKLLGGARRYLQRHQPDPIVRSRLLIDLAASELREHLQTCDYAAVDQLLLRFVGVPMTALGGNPAQLAFGHLRQDAEPDSG